MGIRGSIVMLIFVKIQGRLLQINRNDIPTLGRLIAPEYLNDLENSHVLFPVRLHVPEVGGWMSPR